MALYPSEQTNTALCFWVAKFLTIKQGMASKALNELHHMGVITKLQVHRTVVFTLADKAPNKNERGMQELSPL